MIDPFLFYTVVVLAALTAVIYFVFGRRFGAAPVKGTILDRFEGAVHLRDIFRLAIGIEEEGVNFYGRLAKQAKSPSVKALCSRLAEEEFSHKELFERQLGSWRTLHSHKLRSAALVEHARQKGILTDPPGENAPEEDMAKFAIAQEVKTAEFYQSFEKALPQEWKRAYLQDLVLEERRHEQDLRAAYPGF